MAIFKLFLLLLSLCSFLIGYGQNTSNKGQDFWIGYMDHIDGVNSNIILYITSDSSTTGTVSVPGQSWSTNFSVTANSMTLVSIPSNKTIVECSDCIEKKGIHVTAKKDIVVYSHIYSGARSDATLVLPTKASGKEFYCMGYNQVISGYYNQFMIVASEDSTRVRITPSDDIKKSSGVRQKGKAYEIVLNTGEVYQGQAVKSGSSLNTDITGTHIQVIDTGKNARCRNVAVFSGSSFNSVGCNGSADNLYQQIFPISALGKTFIVVPFASRNGDQVKFLATKDNTVVNVNGTTYNIDQAEFKEVSVSPGVPLYISSNYPLLVAQFQRTQACGGSQTGDPSMTILTPIEQTLDDIVVYSSSRYNIQRNYINVVIPTNGRSSFRLDGNTVNWTLLSGHAGFSFAQLSVSAGNHRLTANTRFNAIAYGFGNVESYGYVAGANIKKSDFKLEVENTLSLSEIGVCDSTIVNFNAEADSTVYKTWHWDFDLIGNISYDSTKSVLDDDTSILKNPKHIYPKPGKYQVSLKGFRGENNGCSSYDSTGIIVSIFANPKAKFSVKDKCLNTGITFYDSSSIDSGYVIQSKIYDFDDGTFSLSNNITHYYKDTGEYTVRKMVESINGCLDTTETRIYVSPTPTANFSTGQVCYKEAVYFKNKSSIIKGTLDSFIWTFNNFDTAFIKDPSHIFMSKGYKYIKLKTLSDSGCIESKDTNILIPDSMKIEFYSKDECLSTAHVFKNNSSAGNTKLSYKWEFGDGKTSAAISPQYTFQDTGIFTIKLIATQNNTCMDSSSKSFRVFPAAIPNFFIRDTCYGETSKLTSLYTIPVGKVISSKWYLNGAPYSSDSIINYTFYKSGKHNIGLKLKSDNGCESNYFRPISIKENPNPLIAPFGNLDLCLGEKAFFHDSTSTTDSIVKSEWYYGKKQFIGNTISLEMDSLNFTGIKIVSTNKFGCTDSTTKYLTVHPLPSIDFTLPTPCKNEYFTVQNNSSIAQGSIVEWEWENKNTTLSTIQNPKIKINSNNKELIKLIGTTNRLCKDSLELSMNFMESPTASFYSDTVCIGNANSFYNTSIHSTGTIDSFQWNFGDYGKSRINNPSHVYPSHGEYNPILVAFGNNGCKDSFTGLTYIAEYPFAFFKEDKLNGCVPQSVNYLNLSNFSQDSIRSYNWYANDKFFSDNKDAVNSYASIGTYDIKLVVENIHGCTDTFTKPKLHNIYPIPKIDFVLNPKEPDFLNKDLILKDSSLSKDLVSWLWEIEGSIIADWKEIKYSLPDTGWYNIKMTGTDINGCYSSKEKDIYVKPVLAFYMPNAFTPNDNTVNDVFKPEGIFLGLREYEFELFNRWGEILFKSNSPYIGWDGKTDGKPVQNGIYYYNLRYTDFKKDVWYNQTGEVYLIR